MNGKPTTENRNPADRSAPVARSHADTEVPDITATRLTRVVEQVRDISKDVVELAELKLQLVQVQVEERIEGRINQMIGKALVGVFAGIALTFGMIAAAIGLGYLFNNQALGFLTIAVSFAVITLVLLRGRFTYVDFSETHKAHEDPDGQLPPGSEDDHTKQIPTHTAD